MQCDVASQHLPDASSRSSGCSDAWLISYVDVDMMESRGVLSIIFDLDNTLVDTAGAGRIAIQKVN